MSWLQKIRPAVIDRFLSRMDAPDGDGYGPMLIETPSDEIVDAINRGKKVEVWGRRPGVGAPGNGKKKSRIEENILFDTRRYPSAIDNALPAPSHLPANENIYFANAVGQTAQNNGFPSTQTMSNTETNMDIPAQIAQGKDFVFHGLGLAFNSEALSGDIEQILDAGALIFTKQGVQFTLRHGAARLWPGGTGVSGFSTIQGTESAHNGLADPRAVRQLRVPRVIRNLETFQYIYSVPRGTRATTGTNWQLSQFTLMSVYLWGGQRDSIPV